MNATEKEWKEDGDANNQVQTARSRAECSVSRRDRHCELTTKAAPNASGNWTCAHGSHNVSESGQRNQRLVETGGTAILIFKFLQKDSGWSIQRSCVSVVS